jgi:hypothetical protein
MAAQPPTYVGIAAIAGKMPTPRLGASLAKNDLTETLFDCFIYPLVLIDKGMLRL